MQIINETYNETTRSTPSEIFLGKKPERPWKEFFEILGTQELSRGTQEGKIEKARENMHTFLENRNERKNANKTHFKFKIGQKVLIKDERKSDAEKNIIAKFLYVYEGPYTIKGMTREETYILVNENNDKRGTFYLNDLSEHLE